LPASEALCEGAGEGVVRFVETSRYLRNVQEFDEASHVHRLMVLSMDVPWRVHRDDELGTRRQRAFQKTVVGFVLSW